MSLWTGRAFVSGRIFNFQERFSASHGKHLDRSFFSPFFARTPFASFFAQLLGFCRAGCVLLARTPFAPFFARLLCFCRTGSVLLARTGLVSLCTLGFCAVCPIASVRRARTAPRVARAKKPPQKSAARADKIRRYLTTDEKKCIIKNE